MRHKKKSPKDETGSASLEFIVAGMILIIPFVYLVMTLAQLHAAQLAVEGAARFAARLYVKPQNDVSERAQQAIYFALHDYGFGEHSRDVRVVCAPIPDNCSAYGSTITVTVRVDVDLPFIPSVFQLDHFARIPVVATAHQSISKFAPPHP